MNVSFVMACLIQCVKCFFCNGLLNTVLMMIFILVPNSDYMTVCEIVLLQNI
jgi:hypothetical protein